MFYISQSVDTSKIPPRRRMYCTRPRPAWRLRLRLLLLLLLLHVPFLHNGRDCRTEIIHRLMRRSSLRVSLSRLHKASLFFQRCSPCSRVSVDRTPSIVTHATLAPPDRLKPSFPRASIVSTFSGFCWIQRLSFTTLRVSHTRYINGWRARLPFAWCIPDRTSWAGFLHCSTCILHRLFLFYYPRLHRLFFRHFVQTR